MEKSAHGTRLFLLYTLRTLNMVDLFIHLRKAKVLKLRQCVAQESSLVPVEADLAITCVAKRTTMEKRKTLLFLDTKMFWIEGYSVRKW